VAGVEQDQGVDLGPGRPGRVEQDDPVAAFDRGDDVALPGRKPGKVAKDRHPHGRAVYQLRVTGQPGAGRSLNGRVSFVALTLINKK
jgi:hypothetical protein